MKASIDAAGTGAIAVPVRVRAAPSAQRAVQALAVSTAALLLSFATSISSMLIDVDPFLGRDRGSSAEVANIGAVAGTAAAQLVAGLLLLALVRHLVRGIGPDDDGFRAADVARAWAFAAAVLLPLAVAPVALILCLPHR